MFLEETQCTSCPEHRSFHLPHVAGLLFSMWRIHHNRIVMRLARANTPASFVLYGRSPRDDDLDAFERCCACECIEKRMPWAISIATSLLRTNEPVWSLHHLVQPLDFCGQGPDGRGYDRRLAPRCQLNVLRLHCLPRLTHGLVPLVQWSWLPLLGARIGKPIFSCTQELESCLASLGVMLTFLVFSWPYCSTKARAMHLRRTTTSPGRGCHQRLLVPTLALRFQPN